MSAAAEILSSVAVAALAWPTSAVAEEHTGVPPAMPSAAAPARWRAAMSVELGTLRKPSECPNYCDHAYGPALGVSAGRMVLPTLAVIGEGWLFQRYALAVTGGVQLWLGERSWIRGSVGVMDTSHHNSDGGEGAGTGPAVSLGGGVRLTRFSGVSTELSARATAVVHEVGSVTSLTVGYGIAW